MTAEICHPEGMTSTVAGGWLTAFFGKIGLGRVGRFPGAMINPLEEGIRSLNLPLFMEPLLDLPRLQQDLRFFVFHRSRSHQALMI